MSATPAAAIPIPGQAISATPAAAGLPPATVKALLDAAADTSTRFGVDAATAMLLNQIAEHQQQSAEHLATMACAFSTTKLSAFIGVEQATIDAYSTALSNHFSTAINTLIKPQFDQLSQRLDNLEQSGKRPGTTSTSSGRP